MSPDAAWALVTFGVCTIWITVVALGDWLYRRRNHFDPDECHCWICEGTRAHREQIGERG